MSEHMTNVTAADALEDAAWFERRPQRRYRLRPGWVVRWKPASGVFLRCLAPKHVPGASAEPAGAQSGDGGSQSSLGGSSRTSGLRRGSGAPDDEGAAERLWWEAAYPTASIEWRLEMAKEVRPKPASKSQRKQQRTRRYFDRQRNKAEERVRDDNSEWDPPVRHAGPPEAAGSNDVRLVRDSDDPAWGLRPERWPS